MLVVPNTIFPAAAAEGEDVTTRPSSDAVAPSVMVPDSKAAETEAVAADALKLDDRSAETVASKALPAAAKAYASADPEAPIAFRFPTRP